MKKSALPLFLVLALVVMRESPPRALAADEETAADADARLVRTLLAEDLSARRFSFATIAEANSGKRVLPLDDSPAHRRVVAAIDAAVAATIEDLNRPNSPLREVRRINEASRFFEDAIQQRLAAVPGLACDVPLTRDGKKQRSGYPDLEITDLASGIVFYLDPKLVEQNSAASSFRTFYFEPKNETLKITRDAVHLLVGIEHDGAVGEWRFGGWRLVDLSKLSVRLKAEFQASNADLYRETVLSMPPAGR